MTIYAKSLSMNKKADKLKNQFNSIHKHGLKYTHFRLLYTLATKISSACLLPLKTLCGTKKES